MFRLISVFVVAAFCLVSLPVRAKEAKEDSDVFVNISPGNNREEDSGIGQQNHRFFNLHFAVGGAFAVGDDVDDKGLGDKGGQGTVGMDFVIVEPLALSILGGYNGYAQGDISALRDLFIGTGFRLRFLIDRKGALSEEGGNSKGNLWLDAHLAYHHYGTENHGGVGIGLGYEFSLIKDFNLGPFGRFHYTPWGNGLNYMMFSIGLQVSIGGKFEPDDVDGDGIEDTKDKCEREPEDKDGFQDEDGCRDTDNDGDGIEDAEDECPDLAGVSDKKGCPEDDNDRDAIKNDVDKCPNEAEDKDGFEDEDGCPDLDNDQDGVSDADDKCPDEIEDKDGFEDSDGCPDMDNDKDGILDANDKCPFEPENPNGKDDEDGCLDYVRIESDEIKVLIEIEFPKYNFNILEKSYPVLEEVATILKLKQEMKVRIEGHTDDRGDQQKKLKLSKSRAESVRKFLVDKGAKESQLEVKGLGGTVPIVGNSTKDGRAQNDRIEFHIVSKPQ